MKKLLGGFCLLTALVISSLAAPVYAEHGVSFKRTVIAPRYDARHEVTLEGTVQSLVNKPAPGMMLGAHLMVTTSKGTVDAHVGNFVTRGPNALSLASGQHVKIVGVMATIHSRQVFLTRTIETGDRTVAVRDAHGFLIVPGAKGHIAKTAVNGGAR